MKELVQECESPILQETANKLADIHEEFEALQEKAAKEGLTTGEHSLVPNDRSPDKQWKWTGSCFVKSPTVEPWVSYFGGWGKGGQLRRSSPHGNKSIKSGNGSCKEPNSRALGDLFRH